MPRRVAVYIIAASLLAFVAQVSARGRSFPIEVTGAIIEVDRGKAEFIVQVDRPACILTIGIGRDCKFKQSGAPAGEQILKRNARVKVSYFVTIFTGKIAVEIESNPIPEIKCGIIEKIEPADRRLSIRVGKGSCHLVLYWAANARFLNGQKITSAADLRENAVVKVSYFAPAFDRKYAVKIQLEPALACP
jgi:hypothetical protein